MVSNGNGHGNSHERRTVVSDHERSGTNFLKTLTERSRYGDGNVHKTKDQLYNIVYGE
jgi:hypothetical protein